MTEAMALAPGIAQVRVGWDGLPHLPLALGGSWFVPYAEPGKVDADLLGAMDAAFAMGVRHFDTATGYGGGHSEELFGQFIRDKRDEVFIASKADPTETTAEAMYGFVEASLGRLGIDKIDLYYIHWPKSDRDLRPLMEGLERARSEGMIGAVGVSNFSVDDMRSVAEVGRIDAHQLGYNLLWRYAEDDVIPYCSDNGIAVYSYSTLAHGILTGKFARELSFAPTDQRNRILPFKSHIWPHVYEGVEEMKGIAAEIGRPLAHLAIRWNLSRPGMTGAVVGGRNAEQCAATIPALAGEIPPDVFDRLTAISDRIKQHVPDAGNVFGRAV